MTKNIVVVGAGYGGLRTALDVAGGLRKNDLGETYKIVLIDRNQQHVFTPLLYKLAAAKAFPEPALGYDLKDLVAPAGISFIEDEIREIDLMNGDVHLAHGEELRSDYLVIAPGSETNYFGIPGLADSSLPLKTLADARAIRDRLKALGPSARVIVGGGGATGIELAAEIRTAHGLQVDLVEAMPTLLPGFDPRLAALALKRLMKLGVTVRTDTAIAEAKPDRIVTKAGKEIQFELLIWTGGVKAPAWVGGLPIKVEMRGRIETAAGMECLPSSEDLQLAPMTYALGDAVCVYGKDGKPMPGVARAAILQGRIVAVNILADILVAEGRIKQASHKAYRPMRYPYVLPIGGNYAIGTIGSFLLRGLPAFAFKELITLDYLLSIMQFNVALRTWVQTL
jgi:NADH dehydrogenase